MANKITIRHFSKYLFSAIFASSLSFGTSVQAEEDLIGSGEFFISCASCHGVGARGNGNLAQYLNIKPTDLTMLSKKNGGEYPFLRIFQIIDGRTQVSGHGERIMPIWGDRYTKEGAVRYGAPGGEVAVRARVLELVYYIQSIQQK